MSTHMQRLLWGTVMTPMAALLGFLVGGHLASALSNSGSGLADSASVVLIGLALALVAAGGTIWAASRRPVDRLPRTAITLLLLTAVTLWITIAAADRRGALKAEQTNEQQLLRPP